MKKSRPFGFASVSVLAMALALAACGSKDNPEALMASAKEYLAKNDNKAAVIQLKNVLQSKPDLAEARFLLAKAMLESGDPAAADVELRKAADLKYSPDQVIPLQARTLLMLGQTPKVEDLAKSQLTSPEAKADLQTTVGRAYLAQAKLDAAQKAFDTAIAAVPDYGPAVFGQARIKAVNRDFLGAIALLDSVLAKDPNFYEALQFKGDLLTIQGKPDEAISIYQQVLQIRPEFVPARASLISRYMETGNLDEAAKQFDLMKKGAPSNPQTTYVQAELLYRQKKFLEARQAIAQHLKNSPGSLQGQQLAGLIEVELKSYATAENYLLAVLPKSSDLSMARRALIMTYLRSGQPSKALSILQPVLDKIGNNSDMLALAGEVFMQNGETEKAGTYFAKAAALDPGNTRKQTSVALSHLAKGDVETAYKELESVALSDPGTKADMALVAAQLKSRKFDQALKSILSLEKKQPENPLVDNLRGIAYLGKGDFKTAKQHFEKALAKNPAYFPAAASLARMDVADRRPDDARKRFESVVAKDPRNTQAWLALAELQAKSGGKPEEVAGLIGKAITADPTNVPARLELINLYIGTQEPKKAIATAQEALGALPDNTAILDAMGRAQQASGDSNQALATYGKLATLLPSSVQPYLRMAEIHWAAKNKEEAMRSLQKGLSVKPDSIEVQRGILMIDLDANRTPQAVATARNIQKQNPKNPVGYTLEGDIYVLSKSWKEAAEAYRNGIGKTDDASLAIKLHAVLASQGAQGDSTMLGDAGKFADRWMSEHPKDSRFRLYMAESARGQKNYPEAIKHYRILLDSQPNNPALLNNLAWIMGQTKDPKALEYAEKAYKLAPEQPSVADTLGSLLVAKGDVNRGIELLKKAYSLAPKDPMIQLNYAKGLIKAGDRAEAKKQLEELSAYGEKFVAYNEVKDLLQRLQ